MINHPQEKYMKMAIEEAKTSVSSGQYAIAAVIVDENGEILSVDHTTIHSTNDATAHAEVNAIRSASAKLKNRYLLGCWLYTTLEPCPMCTGATIWAMVEGIVFGASKEDAQEFAKKLQSEVFTWRQIDISSKDVIEKGEPKVKLVEKFMNDECKTLFNFAIKV